MGEAKVTEDHCVWKVTKPLNTTCAMFTYRRLADITGTWKLVAVHNIEAAYKQRGVPESIVKTMAAGELPIVSSMLARECSAGQVIQKQILEPLHGSQERNSPSKLENRLCMK